jgi:glycosyltransferase involved in cell wall biosynthesis
MAILVDEGDVPRPWGSPSAGSRRDLGSRARLTDRDRQRALERVHSQSWPSDDSLLAAGAFRMSDVRIEDRPIPLRPLPARPLVSVLMTNHNGEAYIEQAVESVLRQTWDHLDVIVVDDGSTDDSRSILMRLASGDPRITVIEKEHGGVTMGWNAAFAASSGDVVCFLDADDLFLPGKVESAVDNLRGDAGLFLHPLVHVDKAGRPLPGVTRDSRIETGWIAPGILARGGLRSHPPTGGMAFRREVADLLFPIPHGVGSLGPDAYLITLAALLTQVAADPRRLGCYRVHGANIHYRRQIDAVAVRKDLALYEGVTSAVNVRLRELGLSSLCVDASKNVWVDILYFFQSLFEGERRVSLLGRYVKLVPRVLRDDYLSPMARMAVLCLYASAIALPVDARSVWISRGREKLREWRDRAIVLRRRLGLA